MRERHTTGEVQGRKGLVTRGGHGYHISAQIFVAHILNLRRTGRWPARGYVVCTGVSAAMLAPVLPSLPACVAAQLVPYLHFSNET